MPSIATKITKIIFLFSLFLAVLFFSAQVMSPVSAQSAQDFGIGTIEEPPGVDAYNQAAGVGADETALLFFVTRMIRAVSLVAGVWSLGNVMFAGFTYITGKGDTAAHQKVRDYITMSAIGLMLIVASYTVGGILGLVFFGDASFLLNPTF